MFDRNPVRNLFHVWFRARCRFEIWNLKLFWKCELWQREATHPALSLERCTKFQPEGKMIALATWLLSFWRTFDLNFTKWNVNRCGVEFDVWTLPMSDTWMKIPRIRVSPIWWWPPAINIIYGSPSPWLVCYTLADPGELMSISDCKSLNSRRRFTKQPL